jgi:outer membrane protein OmpA-like peptidoglycan-associated protein
VNSILHLQRTIGNQAVLRLLEANTGDVEGESTTSETACFSHDVSQIPVYPKTPVRVQAKLTVSTPGDIYEQEADRVADEVMRTPAAAVLPGMEMPDETQGRPVRRMCAQPEEGEQNIRRREAAGETPTVTPAVAARLDATRGSGEPLSKSVRSFMEPRFGVDFSGVRVHTGSMAAWLNQELKSQAFTQQRDIYFGAGKYEPESAQGKRLLTHELAHVIQQSGSMQPEPRIDRQNAQETGEVLNEREAKPVLLNIVQRQGNPNDEGSEKDIVESVIEAMQQPNPTAGACDVDSAFTILNKYSLPFLLRVLAEVYDRGYFHGLLGYLAPGTKAENKVIVAIRFIQCQKEPSNLAYEEIIEAENFLKRLYNVRLSAELQSMFDCLERERVRHEKRREQQRLEGEIQRERQKAGVRQGPKTLAKGTMDWWLVPLPPPPKGEYQGQPSARIQIMFTPNGANRNKTIVFLQTVLETTTSSVSTQSIPLLDIGRTTPFDPFYGGDYSPKEKEWQPEEAPTGYKNAPSSAVDPTAYLYDEPSVPPTMTKTFESVVVVPATGEVLGALKWGVSWVPGWAKVFGGESKDCTETPSADYRVALERFYATSKTVDMAQTKPIGAEHYAAILDGFIVNDATLTSAHKKPLDQIVEQLKKYANLSVIVGGFADESEKDPFGISEQRAVTVKSYLIDHGVQKDRIKIGGFGATWARFPPSTKENRHRRVQILLRF